MRMRFKGTCSHFNKKIIKKCPRFLKTIFFDNLKMCIINIASKQSHKYKSHIGKVVEIYILPPEILSTIPFGVTVLFFNIFPCGYNHFKLFQMLQGFRLVHFVKNAKI